MIHLSDFKSRTIFSEDRTVALNMWSISQVNRIISFTATSFLSRWNLSLQNEHILPLYAPSKKLRSENQINSRIRSICFWLQGCSKERILPDIREQRESLQGQILFPIRLRFTSLRILGRGLRNFSTHFDMTSNFVPLPKTSASLYPEISMSARLNNGRFENDISEIGNIE